MYRNQVSVRENYDCYMYELISTSWMQPSQKFFPGGKAEYLNGEVPLMKGKWNSKFWDYNISLEKKRGWIT